MCIPLASSPLSSFSLPAQHRHLSKAFGKGLQACDTPQFEVGDTAPLLSDNQRPWMPVSLVFWRCLPATFHLSSCCCRWDWLRLPLHKNMAFGIWKARAQAQLCHLLARQVMKVLWTLISSSTKWEFILCPTKLWSSCSKCEAPSRCLMHGKCSLTVSSCC